MEMARASLRLGRRRLLARQGVAHPGYDWFERETLSEGELHAILEERGEIDVLVSHDCPARVALELGMLPIAASLSHRRALATIVERMRPALCLHGHLHRTHRTLW
jgi:hypothetical protein